jgi:lysylphosphatidylglycerol synthetase-like protein (DUF2156 family)
MGAIIMFGGYCIIAFITYLSLYWLCAKRYSKDFYAKRMYKFDEYLEEKHHDMIMMSITWIFTLLAFILYYLTLIIRKSIEKHFNIKD